MYTAFLDTIPVIGSATFSGFSYTEQRLDEFYFNYMSGPEYSKLFDVVKLLLVLSHGQASVERGFSVNKEVEVENLKMRSIVAQRLICDHVNSVGGVMNVDINPKLLMSASAARTKYEAYLNDEKLKRQTEQEQRKRKDVMDSVDKVKEQRNRLKTDIDSLIKSADDLSEKAEVTGNLTFISKANSFRRTSKEKQVQ